MILKTAEERIFMLRKTLKAKEAEVDRLKEIERYAIQLKSDFEQFRLISQKEQQRTILNANEYLIEKLIPILTNFERAMKFTPLQNCPSDIQRILKGYEMIYQMFRSFLENEGLRKISAPTGSLFDPFEHEVVGKVETTESIEGTILEVVEEGYKFRNRVISPCKVKVAIEPQKMKVSEQEPYTDSSPENIKPETENASE